MYFNRQLGKRWQLCQRQISVRYPMKLLYNSIYHIGKINVYKDKGWSSLKKYGLGIVCENKQTTNPAARLVQVQLM